MKLFLILILIPFNAFCGDVAGMLIDLEGSVKIIRDKRNIPAMEYLFVEDFDIINTTGNGKVTVLLRNGDKIRIFENSKLDIGNAKTMKILQGSINAVVKDVSFIDAKGSILVTP